MATNLALVTSSVALSAANSNLAGRADEVIK
jgi:hypothetical protein